MPQVGETDSPYDPFLTAHGHKQAARIGFQLRNEGISKVVVDEM
jgi:broad specificity phosphatase PhoE